MIVSMIWLILLNSFDINNAWMFSYNNKIVKTKFTDDAALEVKSSKNEIINETPIFYPRIREGNERPICSQRICVPHHLCVNDTVVRNGAGLLQNRLTDSNNILKEASYCEDTETCCKLGVVKDDADIEGSLVVEDDEESNEIPMTKERQCGQRNHFGFESRISGGEFAEYAEFPWMILILTKSENSSVLEYICGGSLIHPSVVLTSAHCIESMKPGKLVIRAGDYDTGNIKELFPHQDRDVRSIVIHKGYSRASLYNDIALLIVTKPVELTNNVNTVCLPSMKSNFDGRRCFVSGWGKDSYGKNGTYQSILKKVEVPVIPRDVCQRQLRKTYLGKFFRLHRSFICAGGGNGDSCKGDGGSPLMCTDSENGGTFYQAGIVAWGIGCNQQNVPAGYVNVGILRQWVDSEFKKRHLEMEFYIGNLT